MTARDYDKMTAVVIMTELCPEGFPIDDVEVEQDYDTGSTTIYFEDKSRIVISDGNSVTIY